MSTVVLWVELATVAGQKANYIARAGQHREAVLANEPGCQRFDVVVPDETEDMVMLYEIYTDEQAFKTHTETPYMKQYREDTAPMITQRKITRCTLVV